jgi:hypothetical protein
MSEGCMVEGLQKARLLGNDWVAIFESSAEPGK